MEVIKNFYGMCTVTAEEDTSGGGTASGSNLTFTNRHIVHSFTGVVAFTDLSALEAQ